jgi:hypothetical protein
MADDDKPSILPVIAGAFIGTALGSGIGNKRTQEAIEAQAGQLQEKLDELREQEAQRLEIEEERLAVLKEQRRQKQADGAWQRDVLWLDRCNNEERFDYLVQKKSAAIVSPLADFLANDVPASATIAPDLAALAPVRKKCRQLEKAIAGLQEALKKHSKKTKERSTNCGCFLLLALPIGGISAFFAPWIVTVIIITTAIIIFFVLNKEVRLKADVELPNSIPPPLAPPPFKIKQLNQFLADARARHSEEKPKETACVNKLRAGIEQLRLQLEKQPGIPAHAEILRRGLDAAQNNYPPSSRCDPKQITDTTLFARLTPALHEALNKKFKIIVESLSA